MALQPKTQAGRRVFRAASKYGRFALVSFRDMGNCTPEEWQEFCRRTGMDTDPHGDDPSAEELARMRLHR